MKYCFNIRKSLLSWRKPNHDQTTTDIMVLSHESPIKSRHGEARQGLELQRKLWPELNTWPSYQGQYGRGGFLPRAARGGVSALSGELKMPLDPSWKHRCKMEACVIRNQTNALKLLQDKVFRLPLIINIWSFRQRQEHKVSATCDIQAPIKKN